MTRVAYGDNIHVMGRKTKQYINYIKYKINRFLPLFIFLLVYLLMFFLIENMDAPEYFYTYGTVDKMIPFCEFFVVPYFSWFLLVPCVCVYLLFTREREYKRMSYMLVFGMSTFIIISVIVPTKLCLRPCVMPRDNIFCGIVSYLYNIDTATNVFPSIHVYDTCVVMQAVRKSSARAFKKPWMRISVYVLSVLIILSTVFIKQHSILDVAGGILLFVIADGLVTLNEYNRGFEPVADKKGPRIL